MTLYKTYAAELSEMIESGALIAGQRMPSVREASRHRGLSAATVQKAYHWLEARGLIAARLRSGYYVSRKAQALPSQPTASRSALQSTVVRKGDLIFEVLDAVQQGLVVPLGSAFPSPLLFPLQRLYRSLNRSVRDLDPWRTVTDLSPGNADLRRQIALRYHIDGMEIAPDELVITDGAMEALNLCLQAVTRPGDAVVIESPTFYVALQALERLGLRAIEVATHPAEGIDLDALDTVLKRNRPAACWLMPNFQNPTGALMPEDRKQRLVDLLERHGVPLIEDDVYGELYYAPMRPKPAKAFDRTGNVLHCGSFSKCLAPGYRIGWAAPGRYAGAVRRLKLGTTLSAAIPSQLALANYLEGAAYDRHLRQLRDALFIERDAMINAIREFFPKGTKVTRPEGGYFLWVELPKGTDALQLHRLAMAQGISIAPGAIFSARDRFAHCIRLNYGHPEDRRVGRALKTLGRLALECV
ncbi:MAG: PLP-dependent aminotransferase family protein [Pseudomonadota bacterium]|nr:PLP-dependent aminotransferase family protein [Pseudomonadota bacterium]